MTPTTITQARQARARIQNRVALAWYIAGYVAMAAYLVGRGLQAQRAAEIITHDRVLIHCCPPVMRTP